MLAHKSFNLESLAHLTHLAYGGRPLSQNIVCVIVIFYYIDHSKSEVIDFSAVQHSSLICCLHNSRIP